MRDRLYRSRSDRMLFGVAGGMARFLDIDPSIVRIVWALLFLAGGAGLLLYIVAAIVIPEEPIEAHVMAAGGQSESQSVTVDGSAGDRTADAAAGTPGPAWGHRAGLLRHERGGGAMLFGLVLVVAGAWFLLQRFLPQIDSGLVWPAVLLLVGGALVMGALRR